VTPTRSDNKRILSLRLSQPIDEELLAAVYADTAQEELSLFAWSAEQKAVFCLMQFRMQTRAYEMRFPDAECYVIEHEGQDVGRLLINRGHDEIRLIDVALLAKFRNNGLGTILLEDLMEEAQAARKSIGLSVLKTNLNATRLYEKLGFRSIDENQTHIAMQWRYRKEK